MCVVGNDLSEPDTFILQGQREVHERKHKEGNTPTSSMNQTLVRQRFTLSTADRDIDMITESPPPC